MALTYTPIATTTLGSAQSSVTFNSFSGYTDLILVVVPSVSNAGVNMYCRFNGDTSTNYSGTYIYGNGTSAVSGRQSNVAQIQVDIGGGSTSFNSNYIYHIQNYANTTTYKTGLVRANENGYVGSWVNMWRSTAAITSMQIYMGSGNFNIGSTFTLYGIAAA